MPMMALPPDDVLKVLGKMTLWFAELEFYVNECLLRLMKPSTKEEARRITGREFNFRAKKLKQMLQERSAVGTLWVGNGMRPPITFSPQLTDLSDQRNLLTHGIAYTALKQQGQQFVCKSYKFSSRSMKKASIDEAADIENLVALIEKAAEQANLISINLWLEEQQNQSRQQLPE